MDRIVPMEDLAEEPQGHSFGWALDAMKAGHDVTREGWHKKGMSIGIYPAGTFYGPLAAFIGIMPDGLCGELVPWLASQTDMLAEDWRLAE